VLKLCQAAQAAASRHGKAIDVVDSNAANEAHDQFGRCLPRAKASRLIGVAVGKVPAGQPPSTLGFRSVESPLLAKPARSGAPETRRNVESRDQMVLPVLL